jgi:hypothetical protein
LTNYCADLVNDGVGGCTGLDQLSGAADLRQVRRVDDRDDAEPASAGGELRNPQSDAKQQSRCRDVSGRGNREASVGLGEEEVEPHCSRHSSECASEAVSVGGLVDS